MTTKHTPGPWRTICPPSMSADSRFIFGENDEWIASIHQRQGMQQEESLSNAHLIAAAPELLETTTENTLEWQDLLVVLRSNPTWSREKMDAWITKKATRTIEGNRATIAKATK